MLDPRVDALLRAGSVTGRSGRVHALHSGIDREECAFLAGVIGADPGIARTLEVGCGYGVSSLCICCAIDGRPGASHTIVDPFQNTQWDGAGVLAVERAGLGFARLVEVGSEIALPRELEAGAGRFDLVFVDGWHTFDHTLLDCFYATRLLRVGGYLVVDDVSMPSVRRAVSFLRKYPCYELHGALASRRDLSWKKQLARLVLGPIPRALRRRLIAPAVHDRIFDLGKPRMVALRKATEDARGWDWHDEAF